jgi:hypothetical protein
MTPIGISTAPRDGTLIRFVDFVVRPVGPVCLACRH